MPAIFNNNTLSVLRAYGNMSARAVRSMAEDVVKVSNPKTPHSGTRGGGLRSQRRIEQVTPESYRIHWESPYAEYQNRGSRRDGSRRVRNYTTPGTGAGFVELGLKVVKQKYKEYFR